MNDQGFHEIQLSGKQLVFLFMSAVVLAVVIFLLGVSVGRGVRASVANASAADVGAPTDTTASAAPSGTKVTPADLDYRDKLQGQSGSGAAAAGAAAGAALGAAAGAASSATKSAETSSATPGPKATSPAATPEASPAKPPDKKPNLLAMTEDPSKSKTPTPTPTTTAKPTPTPAKPAPAVATPPKPAGNDAGWFVQLNAFSTQNAADGFIKELKSKGYTASAVKSATLFKVRIGPYADHAEADKMASRLVKDGYKPLVTR